MDRPKKKRPARTGCAVIVGLVVLVIVVSAIASSGGSNSSNGRAGSGHRSTSRHHRPRGSVFISRRTFRGTWPFTVPSGVVACIQPPILGAIIFTAQPSTHPRAYGINGTALDDGYPDAKPIWRKVSHGVPGQRVYIGDVIDRGLKACTKPGHTAP